MIGECPQCGDELYQYRTKNRKRLVRCVNESCPKHLIYGLPQRGEIEVSGLYCPKSRLPVLVIIPTLRLSSGRRKQERKKIYFWTDTPCFSCKLQHSCDILAELEEEYL